MSQYSVNYISPALDYQNYRFTLYRKPYHFGSIFQHHKQVDALLGIITKLVTYIYLRIYITELQDRPQTKSRCYLQMKVEDRDIDIT